MLGKWDKIYKNASEPFSYGESESYPRGIRFLEDAKCRQIEDWGCGLTFASRFVKNAEYIGIDGSWSRMASKIVDLREYRSEVDGIFMRHVLEHNHEWQRVLENALASFTKRFVLILFTPFNEGGTVNLKPDQARCQTPGVWKNVEEIDVPDLSFRKTDLTRMLQAFRYTEENIASPTHFGREHIFYVSK